MLMIKLKLCNMVMVIMIVLAETVKLISHGYINNIHGLFVCCLVKSSFQVK